ncbi:MAG: hypothetical protein WD904_05575 [Dehalococcoidia bacterium]
MSWVIRWLGAEIYFIHVGHGMLFVLAVWIAVTQLPWWGVAIGAPLILFSVIGWLAEATIVLPYANHMIRDGATGAGGWTMGTSTTTPRGREVARRNGPSTQDNEIER